MAVLLPAVLSSALADARVPLTLAQAEDLALQNEPGQLEFVARAASLKEQSVAAGQRADPQLRFGLANFPINRGGFTTEGMTQVQLGVRQALGRRKTRIWATRHFLALADAQSYRATTRERDVLVATRVTWLEAYYWQSARDVLMLSRPFFADLVEITQSMYAVGRKTQYDVLRAELELTRLDERLIEADQLAAGAQAMLSQWLGHDAYRPIALKLPRWAPPPDLPELLQALDTHPRMRAAEAEIDARKANVTVAEENKKVAWTVDLGYGFRDGHLPSGSPRSDFVSVSVMVDLPLFRKNRQDRKLGAALSERQAAVAGKRKLQAQLQTELNGEYVRWTNLTRQLALYEQKIVALSASQAEAALLAYQSDSGDFSDVLMSYIDELDIRLQSIRLRVERAQSYARLANLGGIRR
jgi:outer membrane protein TolC